MLESNSIQQITVWVLPILFAVPLHEAAHGLVAWWLGDDTAYRQGRVTLNPLRHIDPFGTIILPGLLIYASSALGSSPFIFGYAKPVPVAFHRLRSPRWGTLLVAAAGPAMNVTLALISAIFVYGVEWLPRGAVAWAGATLLRSIFLNLMLAVFNMIPLPPLDGGRVLVSLLPRRLARPLAQTERYGILILLALLFLLPMLGPYLGLDLSFVPQWLYSTTLWLMSGIVSLTGIDPILTRLMSPL
jgi:Zn-dependent protease